MKTLVYENNKDRFIFNKGETFWLYWCELDGNLNKIIRTELIYTHEEESTIKVNCVKVWRVKDEEGMKDGLLTYIGEE